MFIHVYYSTLYQFRYINHVLFCQIMNLLPQLPHQPQLLQTGNGLVCSKIHEAILLFDKMCLSLPYQGVVLPHGSRVTHESNFVSSFSVLSNWSLLKMARHCIKWTFILVASYKYSC